MTARNPASWRRPLLLGVVGLLVSGGLVASGSTNAAAAASVTIEVLSNRADLISGHDVLVTVNIPGDADRSRVKVFLGSRDMTSSFAVRPGGRFTGLVSGLTVGPNVLTATLGGQGARLTVVDHPSGGPVFAGTQVLPWVCAAGSKGAACERPTTFTWHYKNAITGTFLDFDPKQPPPAAAIARTTTDTGQTVSYIVRQERGSMDRGLYAIAVLADPAKPWSRWAPYAGWNHKIMVSFGGDSKPLHIQKDPGDVLDDNALSRGYLVAGNSLNIHGNNTNDNVSAEAMMMLKEHITETYGDIRHLIGEGCSGGAIQQYQIASMYPGLIDGLIPSCSFPDTLQVLVEVADCRLVDAYFAKASPGLWADPTQQNAVRGKIGDGCVGWDNSYASLLDPSNADNCGLPSAQVYARGVNPRGTRCTIQDYQSSIYGFRSSDGFANRPYDNVGVEYGVEPLRAGTITPEQFVDLNTKVGGLDIDAFATAQRSTADPAALQSAYLGAEVADARQWASVPIIDLRGHAAAVADPHQDYNSYESRARLDEANGTHENQVIWTGAATVFGDPAFGCAVNLLTTPTSLCTANPLLAMDDWLTRIEADRSSSTPAQKVIRNRPAYVTDACWSAGQRITDMTVCRALYPYAGQPRNAAGESMAANILKCQLKPLNRADYPVSFTSAQWSALHQAFPTGVCDWTKPGVAQRASTPWRTYAGGPGGRSLTPAPVSVPFGSGDERAAGNPRSRTSPGSLAATGMSSALAVLALLALCLAAVFRRRPGRRPVEH